MVRQFADADLVVANPAVPLPWDNRFLRAATAAGTPVTTEIRLAIDGLDRERTLGVTGSAGKTTTRAMTALALGGLGRVHQTEGNLNNHIGVPLTLLDTAGIRPTSDRVEQLGIARSREALAAADAVLLLFDLSAGWTVEDEALRALAPEGAVLLVGLLWLGCLKGRVRDAAWNAEMGVGVEAVVVAVVMGSLKHAEVEGSLGHAGVC